MSRLRVDVEGLAGLSGVERSGVLEGLGRLGVGLGGNPLLGFRPWVDERGGCPQGVFLGGGERVRAFFGGNRAGKTTVGVVDQLLQCVGWEWVPSHLVGFKRWDGPYFGRVVTPGLKTTLETVILPAFREWCPVGALLGGSWGSAWDGGSRLLRFEGGSWLQFVSAEMDVNKLGGAKLHGVLCDEEPPEGVWNECLMRLADFGGHASLCMTPQWGLSWSLDRVWDCRGDGGVLCVNASTLDNPFVDSGVVEELCRGLSVEERAARLEGRFVSLEGLVLSGFDVGRDVVPVPDVGVVGGWDVLVGIDPGVRSTAVVWVGFDSAGRACVFDELLLRDEGSLERVVGAMRERNGFWGVDPAYYIIDPAARSRRQVGESAESVESEFLRLGVGVIAGQNDVNVGLMQMKRRLEHGALCVSAGCGEWLRERSRYRWKRDPVNGRDVPVKKDDHLMDATRYVLMERPWSGEVAALDFAGAGFSGPGFFGFD